MTVCDATSRAPRRYANTGHVKEAHVDVMPYKPTSRVCWQNPVLQKDLPLEHRYKHEHKVTAMVPYKEGETEVKPPEQDTLREPL